ncbi:MAG TPA: hypothetical protein VGR35_10220 [Tepidisphaeraceae bacterium]|nr:hypothetical protein [Tepidisphaeraceae bacterium]
MSKKNEPSRIFIPPNPSQRNRWAEKDQARRAAQAEQRARANAGRSDRIRRSPLRQDADQVRAVIAAIRALPVHSRNVMDHFGDALDLLILAMEAGSFSRGWGVTWKTQLANRPGWENAVQFLPTIHKTAPITSVPTRATFAQQREHIASLMESDVNEWPDTQQASASEANKSS